MLLLCVNVNSHAFSFVDIHVLRMLSLSVMKCRVINCPSDYVSVINCRVIECRVIKCPYTPACRSETPGNIEAKTGVND